VNRAMRPVAAMLLLAGTAWPLSADQQRSCAAAAGPPGVVRLTDMQMTGIRGATGATSCNKCCDWFYTDGPWGCSDFDTCTATEFDCDKRNNLCTEQLFRGFTKCKDYPNHPLWTCTNTYLDWPHFPLLDDCVLYFEDPVPADGDCKANQNHGAQCNTPAAGPCGNLLSCIVTGSDMCPDS